MFSRAAKSVVNSLGSRRIHISEKNFTKITLIAGAGKISHNLSQLLRNSAKLNALALYDVAAVNRPLPNYNFYDEQSLKPIPLEMLTMEKKSCSGEDSHSNAAINNATQADNNNHQGNNGKSQTEKLVEALYRLPIAEEAPAFNNPLISIEELMPKLQSKEENSARLKTARFRESGITAEAVKKLMFVQMNGFLKNLPRTFFDTEIFGTGGLGFNRWNHKICSMNMLNSCLTCIRDFSSCKNEPGNILLRHKAFGSIHEKLRKPFLKRSFMTKCKLPLPSKPASTMSVYYSTALPFSLPSFKSYSFNKKYVLPSLPCHHESINLLRFDLYLKFVKKPPFPKIHREKDSRFLEHPKTLKSLTPSKCLKYLLKRKLLPPRFCKQYSSSPPTSYLSCRHSLSQDVSKRMQKAFKRLSKLQGSKTPKTFIHRDPIFLHSVHRRGFHSSLFPLAKSDSTKPPACEKMDKICKTEVTEVKKTDECGRPCKRKSDICSEKRVKCDKSQRNNEKAKQTPKTENKIVDPECKKTCLPIGKCVLPHLVPPPKMEYAKVTCPPLKFVKPNLCPLISFPKDDKSHAEIKQTVTRKKQICAPPPLPKPPYAPIVLCPCPPPRKVHPGACPCYEAKVVAKRASNQPCPKKKKYPCPTGVHLCPPQVKPCNLKRETSCERRKGKKASAS
ncbi:PREDICTED: uncharacterized protein LOC105463004 isoform X1 [Wasmannia auropunctata]|uniref:uncharacterized protein LOC105463004 isoform X1 n=1 Tax=Wasmannia auropunctata TaxID=64793 RepID=UPI0005EF4ECC|nr:PREDICTED: uncharacterized protein LOC105463004 isoform X1 [Wasmannia auropunctata]